MNLKHRALLLLGLALATLFLWLALRHVKLDQVWQALHLQFDWRYGLGALLAYALFFILKTLRWRYLLAGDKTLTTGKLLPYVLIGYAGNILLPFQIGEVSRALLVSRHYQVATFTSLSTIAVEKLLDLITVLIFLIPALYVTNFQSEILSTLIEIILGLLILFFIMLGSILAYPQKFIGLIATMFRRLPKKRIFVLLQTWCKDSVAGFIVLKDAGILTRVLITSALTWLAMLASLQCAIYALSVNAGLAAAAILLFLCAVGLALPTSPGFLGTIQMAFVVGLLPFGISHESAIAASIFYNALITLPPLLAGIACLLMLGLAPKEVNIGVVDDKSA